MYCMCLLHFNLQMVPKANFTEISILTHVDASLAKSFSCYWKYNTGKVYKSLELIANILCTSSLKSNLLSHKFPGTGHQMSFHLYSVIQACMLSEIYFCHVLYNMMHIHAQTLRMLNM